jgi:hypothetical protein
MPILMLRVWCAAEVRGGILSYFWQPLITVLDILRLNKEKLALWSGLIHEPARGGIGPTYINLESQTSMENKMEKEGRFCSRTLFKIYLFLYLRGNESSNFTMMHKFKSNTMPLRQKLMIEPSQPM